MAGAGVGKAKYLMERGNDDHSADEQRRLESVLFRSFASLILGRLQRRRRGLAQVDVRSKFVRRQPIQAISPKRTTK